MTAKMNRQGQLVLHPSAHEKFDLQSGDALVVVEHDADGRIVLQKRRTEGKKTRGKSYLSPRPVPASVLERIYQRADPEWDRIEAEAVAVGRRALTGRLLKDL